MLEPIRPARLVGVLASLVPAGQAQAVVAAFAFEGVEAVRLPRARMGQPRWAAGEVPGMGPFPAASGPNRTCTFRCIRLSSDYSACLAASMLPWTSAWQEVQTTSVFRYILCMTWAHSGLGLGSALISARLRT